MMEFITANAATLGTGIVALCSMAGAAWLWLQNARSKTAASSANVAIADSQREVYEQLRQRLGDMQADLTRLNEEVGKLRDQVRDRDNKIHALEMHIRDLEHTMRMNNIEVPPFRV